MGKVIAIATREKKRAPMELIASTSISFDKGVGSDSRGVVKGHRQITVMTNESWNIATEELNDNLPWTIRRANILIEGIDLKNTTGKLLEFSGFTLEITGELTPCHRMDEQKAGLTKALTPNWRGGVTCKIISEGSVAHGDEVSLTH